MCAALEGAFAGSLLCAASLADVAAEVTAEVPAALSDETVVLEFAPLCLLDVLAVVDVEVRSLAAGNVALPSLTNWNRVC